MKNNDKVYLGICILSAVAIFALKDQMQLAFWISLVLSILLEILIFSSDLYEPDVKKRNAIGMAVMFVVFGCVTFFQQGYYNMNAFLIPMVFSVNAFVNARKLSKSC